MGITLVKIGSNLTLPAGETTFHQNVLYRPPHSNNASWDALLVESDQLAYLLQMTVASAHPVKQHGLAAGKALLESAGFAGDVRLVFLLPPVVFGAFGVPQAIINDDGKPSKSAADWPQDKWHVATVNGADFWPHSR